MTGPSSAAAPPRLAWALTGSGHYIKETLDLMARLAPLDVFLSKAAEEVMRMYRRRDGNFPPGTRLFRDRAASAPQIGRFYFGEYHTLVVGPATSNTVAKCVQGISDTLPTNAFAQAGKCRVPCIVFACDTAPEMMTEAPHGMVPVYPRRIDLENVERLRGFEATTVVETVPELEAALSARLGSVRPGSAPLERRLLNV